MSAKIRRIALPGSAGEAEDDPLATGSRGRFTEAELGALAQLAHWWRFRQARRDSADPLESHFGGVDAVGAARTTGLTPAAAVFGRPLLPSRGASLLVTAFGVPDPPGAGEVYSVVGLCHFYDTGSGWLSRYSVLGRAPAGVTDTDVRAAFGLDDGKPCLLIVGVDGLTIDWKIEVCRLEVG